MQTIPRQDTYLSPFCDDSPEGLGKWIQVYNLFVLRGNETLVGQNSSRFSTSGSSGHISQEMPAVSGRVYDHLGHDFSGTWSSGSPNTVTLNGGIVVINNTVIELEPFTTNFNESAGHWSPGNIYGTWSFTNGTLPSGFAASTRYMCVLYDPYMPDGTINPTEPGARIVYVKVDELDYSIMAPLWIIRVEKAGTTVTDVTLHLESGAVPDSIEQIGYWKNYIVDGGNFV